MELFFVSSNQHKIREFRQIFHELGDQHSLITLADHPEWEIEVAENGHTYQDNALLKAQAYQKRVHYPIIADDSGVEVAAFPGLLGLHSARWYPGTDHDRTLALLQKMQSSSDRRLTYHCTICLLPPNQSPQFFTGDLEGVAALKPSHVQGFGYDPIFIPHGYQETFNQLGQNVKNTFSHRRQAIEKLFAYLSQNHVKNMV